MRRWSSLCGFRLSFGGQKREFVLGPCPAVSVYSVEAYYPHPVRGGGGLQLGRKRERERGRTMQWEAQIGSCPRCGKMISATQFINDSHQCKKEGESDEL